MSHQSKVLRKAKRRALLLRLSEPNENSSTRVLLEGVGMGLILRSPRQHRRRVQKFNKKYSRLLQEAAQKDAQR